jgi:hypothetical protein
MAALSLVVIVDLVVDVVLVVDGDGDVGRGSVVIDGRRLSNRAEAAAISGEASGHNVQG